MEGSSVSKEPAYSWPRLRATAKPLGAEAKQAKETGADLTSDDPLDAVESRIFVQGGEWVGKEVNRLRSFLSEDLRICIQLEDEKEEHEEEEETEDNGVEEGSDSLEKTDTFVYILQGHVTSILEKDQQEGLAVGLATDDGRVCNVLITSSRIWWCLPYWAAADQQVSDSLLLRAGFYFLAVPDQRFAVAVINQAEQAFSLDLRIDGIVASRGTILKKRSIPRNLHLFESGPEKGTGIRGPDGTWTPLIVRGREFTFTERELGEEGDGTGHDQQLILGTSSLALTRLLTFEDLWFGPDSNFSGLDSDGETSDESYDPNKPEGKTQPRNSVCSRRLRNGKGRGNAQRRVQGSWEALRVKKDSQLAFSLSLAPAQGDVVVATEDVDTSFLKGRKEGEIVVHYRSAAWFDQVEYATHKQDKAAQDSESQTVCENGAAKSKSLAHLSVLPDGVPDSRCHPDRRSTLKRARGTEIEEEMAATSRMGSAADIKVPRRDSQPPALRPHHTDDGGPTHLPLPSETIKVRYFGSATDSKPERVIMVPHTMDCTTFKALATEALSGRDVVGESIRGARLRWTYTDSDGEEVDIGPYTNLRDVQVVKICT